MQDIVPLRDIAALLLFHVQMRQVYVDGLPFPADKHIETGRMILGNRLSNLVEGEHRPLDLTEALDIMVSALPHFAKAKDAAWGLAGPCAVVETPGATDGE